MSILSSESSCFYSFSDSILRRGPMTSEFEIAFKRMLRTQACNIRREIESVLQRRGALSSTAEISRGQGGYRRAGQAVEQCIREFLQVTMISEDRHNNRRAVRCDEVYHDEGDIR